MAQRFPSRIDGWFTATVLGVIALVLGTWAGAYLRQGIAGVSLLVTTLSLATTTLLVWVWRGTHYELDEEQLTVRSGPFRWRVSLAQVRQVTPSRSLLSSPALSLHRLRIDYGRASSLLVSPSDIDGFLRALRQRCPQVALTGF